jgi:2-oxo-4-hydroxy-4-carboxy-5-ureidoimidazoline decarboxylase
MLSMFAFLMAVGIDVDDAIVVSDNVERHRKMGKGPIQAAIDGTLTRASAAEQASAGLDRLTPAEFARFHDLNARYRARFGFPFIICVRLTDKAGILAAMEARLANDPDSEIAAAIDEIGKITRLRLEDAA